MATPSNLYIPLQGIQTYFVDKDDGFPLAAGYINFYQDVARSVPKDVYQQVQLAANTYGFVNIGSTVPLSSVGTTQSPNDGTDIQVYLFPWEGTEASPGEIDLYYAEFYSSGATLQFTREAIPPNVIGNSNVDNFAECDNQIENSQFVETFLPSTYTRTFTISSSPATISVAPNWDIVTTGTGSVTVTQDAIADVATPTGAPFALRISSTSTLTSVKLRQRFTESPRLFLDNYVSGSFIAKSFLADEVNILMDYVASNGYTVNLVNASTTNDGNYSELKNQNSTLIASTNADSGRTGYVDIILTIPVLADVGISSVQTVTVLDENSTSSFVQDSTLRQRDHLFSYYEDALIYKPTKSWLVGWDFPLNPAQFSTASAVAAPAIGANKSQYVWDQTIMFQSANSGIATDRDTSGAIKLTAGVNTQCAIIQYLDQDTARDLLHNKLSVYIEHNTTNATALTATVSLWYTTDASLPNPAAGTNNSIVGALDGNGKPIAPFNGNWTEVPRGTFGDALFYITAASSNTYNVSSFSGWDMVGNAATNTAKFFAIVVGTSTITAASNVSFLSVSLVSGDNPTRPAAQSPAEVLKDCEYFYEKSYLKGVAPGTASDANNELVSPMSHSYRDSGGFTHEDNYPSPFGIRYRTTKRIAPTVYVYSPVSGTADYVRFQVYNGNTQQYDAEYQLSTNFTALGSNTNGVSYRQSNNTIVHTSSSGTVESHILYHYVADSRLGIV